MLPSLLVLNPAPAVASLLPAYAAALAISPFPVLLLRSIFWTLPTTVLANERALSSLVWSGCPLLLSIFAHFR